MASQQSRDRKRNRATYFQDVREIACHQVGIGFGAVAVDPNTVQSRDYFTLTEPGSEETFKKLETLPNGAQIETEEDVIVRKQITFVPCIYTMTTNRDAILTAPQSRRREQATT